MYFEYSGKEIEYLKNKDRKISEVIDVVGIVQRPIMPNIFEAIIKRIIGQQISTKAQETVWGRMVDFFGEATPQTLSVPVETIQGFGMTTKKAEYIQNIVTAVLEEKINLDTLRV